jgi:hypothetical protein
MVLLSGSIKSTYVLYILMRCLKIVADYCLRHLVENVPIHMTTVEWGLRIVFGNCMAPIVDFMVLFSRYQFHS